MVGSNSEALGDSTHPAPRGTTEMAKPTADSYTEALTLYDRLVAGHPEVERKGKTMPYTSVNGHMFSILAKNGVLGLRLSKDDREAFIEAYDTRLLENYGTVMKEYAAVPSGLLAKTDELQPFFARSYTYVSSLKPKPTTRKKKGP